jgi:signal transduction histidine kinase
MTAPATPQKRQSLLGIFMDVLHWRTYARLLYLLLGFPVGLFYFIALLLGFSLGLGLSVVVIGIPVLLLTIASVNDFASIERRLARALVGVDIAEPEEILPEGMLAQARLTISKAIFWKALTFLSLKWIISTLCFVVVIVFWSVSFALLAAPLYPAIRLEFALEFPNLQDNLQLTLLQSLALSAAGFGLILISARVTNALAQVTAQVARFMLTDNQDEAEAQRLKLETMTLASNAALLASRLALSKDFTATLEGVLQSACKATGALGGALMHNNQPGAFCGFTRAQLEDLKISGALSAEHSDWSERRVGARGRVLQSLRNANASILAIVPLRNSSSDLLVAAYPATHRNLRRSDLEFLEAITDQIGVGLENARLIQAAQNQAALEERHRLARELHDSVSQALYGIALGARTAKAQLARDPQQVSEPLDYVLQLAEAGLSEMRALIFELRPEALEVEGLVVALRKQAEAIAVRYKLPVNLELPDEPSLPLETKQALLRIAQEAMHNAVKHARASQMQLKLVALNSGWKLEITDDGVGFDASQRFEGHLGQHSMRERAASIGARYTLETAPGRGTRIQVWLES